MKFRNESGSPHRIRLIHAVIGPSIVACLLITPFVMHVEFYLLLLISFSTGIVYAFMLPKSKDMRTSFVSPSKSVILGVIVTIGTAALILGVAIAVSILPVREEVQQGTFAVAAHLVPKGIIVSARGRWR